MTKRKGRAPSKRKAGTKAGRHAALVPQEHGGAIYNAKGSPPGPGRPRNETRARLRSILDEHGVPFVEQVLSGEVAIRLVQKCEHCGKEPISPAPLTVSDVLKIVPSVSDRLSAFDSAAKLSLGVLKGVSDEELTVKVRETLQVVYDVLGPDGYTAALPRLQDIWTRK